VWMSLYGPPVPGYLGPRSVRLPPHLRVPDHDPVGGADHVEVVLDDDDAVSGVHQPLQHRQQPGYVGGVQSCGRFVEQVEGMTPGAAGQLFGQLDALSSPPEGSSPAGPISK